MMRYEIKYAIPLIDRAMIEQTILAHPASFQLAYPERIVNNIYFDSPDLQSFYQNINGDPIRTKVRYRWYGSRADINKGHIELKRKDHQLGWKEHLQVPLGVNALEHAQNIQEGGLPHSLQATLWNAYKRNYFESMDGKFRITIDEELQFGNYLNPNSEAIEEQTILEIKFDKEFFEDFNEINKYLPYRQTKFSKYAVGVTKLLF